MPNLLARNRIAIAVGMIAAIGVYADTHAADFGKQTSADDVYVQQAIREQMEKPAYRSALKVVEDAEMAVTSERSAPYRSELRDKTKIIGRIRPVISPVLMRREEAGTAVVVFDITGSGRVTHVAVVASHSIRELDHDLALAVSSTLYSPMIEGTTGITRVGMSMALVWELDDGKKRKCGTLPDPPDVDDVMRVCTTVSESITNIH